MKKKQEEMKLVMAEDVRITGTDEISVKKKKTGKVAVCVGVLVVLMGLLVLFLLPKMQRGNLPELPMLTVSQKTSGFKVYESYRAYDGSELINNNPWMETTELVTLPVYKNLSVNEEDMQELDEDSVPKIELPEEYTYASNAAYEDVEVVAEYIKESSRDLLGMENPQINVYGGDYSIHEEPLYRILFFEGSEDITEQIVNYNLNRVTIEQEEDKNTLLVKTFRPDLSEKMGDYPIISVEEAKELLKKGNYTTTVLSEMPGQEYIAKVELVYQTGEWVEFYMPYYCFYVELPQMEGSNGLKMYGTYYVPAVNKAYITNMPKWSLVPGV